MPWTMADGNDGTVASVLREHPRLLGVLFAALLALSQVGSAAGAMVGVID